MVLAAVSRAIASEEAGGCGLTVDEGARREGEADGEQHSAQDPAGRTRGKAIAHQDELREMTGPGEYSGEFNQRYMMLSGLLVDEMQRGERLRALR